MGHFTVNVQSQVKRVIKAGRRFKSESQFALNKNDFQAEWEIGKETIDSELATIVYPNLVLHYALSDRMEVNTEMTLITAMDNSYSEQKTYNADTSYSVKDKWMFTAECFGFVNYDIPQNNLDASLAYVINDLIQFGITAGRGISSAAPKNYFAVTGSWGFNTSRKRYR